MKILNAVNNELGGHPAVAGNVTPEQEAAIHDEIARHINNTAGTSSSGGGILSNLQQAISSGGTATNAIEGGLSVRLLRGLDCRRRLRVPSLQRFRVIAKVTARQQE